MLEGLRDSGEYSTERFWIIVYVGLSDTMSDAHLFLALACSALSPAPGACLWTLPALARRTLWTLWCLLVPEILDGFGRFLAVLRHQMLQRLQSGMFRRIRERPPITNLEEVAAAIEKAQNILVLTGAGVSTSCGIPDFRSANGVYARLKTDCTESAGRGVGVL